MTAKKAKNTAKQKMVSVAKKDDGTVQINLTIAWADIEKNREEVIAQEAKKIEVPGFRKGKAPVEKVVERIPQELLMEKTLAKILPKMFTEAISEHKINPAMYPKFELISAKEGEDWQTRATTAELPDFDLGDYKKTVKNAKTSDIWTPDKGDPKAEKELTREQKENMALQALQNAYQFPLPEILVDEEINSRLSSLLQRLEKLGITLESYLSSLKKTAEELRAEYRQQAQNAIRMDVLLGRIAQEEKITVEEKEIEVFLGAAKASGSAPVDESQKSTIRSFLIKRKVIDSLASLV